MAIESRYRQTLVVKRLVPVLAGGAETVDGADTTLAADTAIGDVSVELVDAAGIAPDVYLRLGDLGEREIRQVASVTGTTVTLTEPCSIAHDSGDAVRQVDDAGQAATDDYGQPVTAPETVATIAGLIQPRSAREVALTSQGGAVIGSHVGYIDLLAGLTTDCWLEHGGVRFDVLSMPDAAGLGHHLELALQAVT